MIIIFSQEKGLTENLKSFNFCLQERKKARGSKAERRSQAEENGEFILLHSLQEKEVHKFFQDAPLVGVDGSLSSFGTSFPYQVALFRALARSSKKGPEGERVWLEEVFSPLLPEHGSVVEEEVKKGLAAEEALARVYWKILAALEAETGRQALKKFCPRVMLWDGAFGRLEKHAPEVWSDISSQALGMNSIMLGVTEEIAANFVAARMETPEEDSNFLGDREILYDLLNPGEAYFLAAEEIKEKARIYVRFSYHPQVIAVDYLTAQRKLLYTALNYLYTITPERGRGFPLWLDLVDAEVRLTTAYVEGMMAAYLDPDLVELFLRPLRSRRDY